MYLFMSIKCILIQIKFDIDINNDELLKTTWKQKKKNENLMVTGNAQQRSTQINYELESILNEFGG
jgi:hypothetical protein